MFYEVLDVASDDEVIREGRRVELDCHVEVRRAFNEVCSDCRPNMWDILLRARAVSMRFQMRSSSDFHVVRSLRAKEIPVKVVVSLGKNQFLVAK